MTRGRFITFEGCEGCGKSTQVQRLGQRLQALGLPLRVTREPGGTAAGEAIRQLLLFTPKGASISAEAEVLLFEASRSQLVRELIRPALDIGEWVISDRFHDSTTVYQGAARKLKSEDIARLNSFAIGDCLPDLTFVLDVDSETAQTRLMRRVRPVTTDRMEAEPPEFHDAVRAGYRELAAREPHRVRLVDGTRDVEKIADEIWQIVATKFALPTAVTAKS